MGFSLNIFPTNQRAWCSPMTMETSISINIYNMYHHPFEWDFPLDTNHSWGSLIYGTPHIYNMDVLITSYHALVEKITDRKRQPMERCIPGIVSDQ